MAMLWSLLAFSIGSWGQNALPTGNESVLNAYTTGPQERPDVAVNTHGSAVWVWTSDGQDTDRKGVFMQGTDVQGSVWMSEQQVNITTAGNQLAPSVAWISPTTFIVSWMNDGIILVRAFNGADGTALTGEVQAGSGADIEKFPVVSGNGQSGFWVCWEAGGQIQGRPGSYSPGAISWLANSTTLNQQALGAQLIPDLATTSSGSSLVVWQSDTAGGRFAIHGRFLADEAPAGNEFRLTSDTLSYHCIEPSVTALSGDTLAVSWVQESTSSSRIMLQFFDATGAMLSDPYEMGSGLEEWGRHPALVAATLRSAVVAWTAYAGGQSDVRMQVVDIELGPFTADTLTHVASANMQLMPTLAMHKDSLIVGFQSGSRFGEATDDGDDFGIVVATATLVCEPSALGQNLAAYLDDSGNALVTADQLDGGSSHSCFEALTFSASQTAFDCSDLGAVDVVLTVTDPGNVQDTDSLVVTVLDTISPVVYVNNLTRYLDGAGQLQVTASEFDDGSIDNCGLPALSLSQTDFGCANIGSQTLTFTATDGSGNAHSTYVTLTVLDTLSPTVVTNNFALYLDGSGLASLVASNLDAGSTDNCGITGLFTSQTAFTCSDIGANDVTLSATDASGNSSSDLATVSVLDTVSPQVVGQNLTLYLDGSGSVALSPSALDDGSTDNCDASLAFSASATTFTCNDLGAQNVTLTATDDSGNDASSTVMVTVLDTISPQAQGHSITRYLDSTGNLTVAAADFDDGCTDNCSTPNLSLSKSSFDCTDLGAQSLSLTATDASGNADAVSVTLTVVDSIAPTSIAQDHTVYLDAAGSADLQAADIDGGSSDNCAITGQTASQSSFSCSDLGSQSIVLSNTDASGNSSSANATVTVLDTLSPTVVTQSVNIYLDSEGSASLNATEVDNGSTDNCTATLTLSLSKDQFTPSDLGTMNLTLTSTDASGNSASSIASVTVLDTVAPVTLAQNWTVYLDATGAGSLIPDSMDAGSTDACDAALTFNASQTTFTCADLGSNSVTLTATDDAGNSDDDVTTVSVLDTLGPILSISDATLPLTSNSFVMSKDSIDTGTMDNCSSAAALDWAFSPNTFDCTNVGTNLVSVTVTDASGNSTTGSINVTFQTTDVDNDGILDCNDDCTDSTALNYDANPTEACDFDIDLSGNALEACTGDQIALCLPVLFGAALGAGSWSYTASTGEYTHLSATVQQDSLFIDFSPAGSGAGEVELSATNGDQTYFGNLDVVEWTYPWRTGAIEVEASSSASALDGAIEFPLAGTYGDEVVVHINGSELSTTLLTLVMPSNQYTISGYTNSKGCYMPEPALVSPEASGVPAPPTAMLPVPTEPLPSTTPIPITLIIPNTGCPEH